MNGTFGGCWCKGDVTPVIIALQMTSEAFRRAQVLRPEPDRGFDLVNRCSQNATLRWRVRSDANSAEVTRYVDQCVPVKLEKVPMELLILLLEKDGHLVTRQQIIERLWGNDVFVDTEHGINTAIRKIRQALKDDPDQPRFMQTVTGKGYRFVAAVANVENGRSRQTPSFAACVGPEAGTLSPDHMDGGAIPISPLQRAAGRFSAAPLRNIVLGTAVLIFLPLLLVAWSSGWLNRSFVRASTVTVQSVAVLPLDNLSGDQEQDFFADGMTDELITMLAKTSSLRVCERENIKAALNGTIAALGSQYVMSLEAVNCRSGDTLAREQVTAGAKEKVLPAFAPPLLGFAKSSVSLLPRSKSLTS